MNTQETGYTTKDLSDARNAAKSFLNAVKNGDETAAKVLLIEFQEGPFKDMHDDMIGYELGEAKADGAQVIVVAIIHVKLGRFKSPPIPLVLVPVAGVWKIDMESSVIRMIDGMDIETMMEQAMDKVTETFGGVVGGMGEVFTAGMAASPQEVDTVVGTPLKSIR